MISAFLDDLEETRGVTARTRNLRLTAIRSFYNYVAYEAPAHAAQIQRILAIPGKRFTRRPVQFLTRPEVDALLAAPDRRSWSGRRDHCFLLLALQTGLRLSEMTALKWPDVKLGVGGHVRVTGKGRKERCTPLGKRTVAALRTWQREPERGTERILFPSARGARLSAHGVHYLLRKHTAVATLTCSSLREKRVTPHVLRRTMALEMLQAGVDRAVIALWLGHESVETTQIYLDANLAMKEIALAKTTLPNSKPGRYRPDDELLTFLRNL